MAQVVLERDYYPAIVVNRIIQTIIGLVEFVIFLRFVLELFGANASSPFVAWIYNISGSLMSPFIHAFPNLTLSGLTIDIVALIAMLAYALLGWIIARFLALIFAW